MAQAQAQYPNREGPHQLLGQWVDVTVQREHGTEMVVYNMENEYAWVQSDYWMDAQEWC